MCDLDKDDYRHPDYFERNGFHERACEVRHGFLSVWINNVQKNIVQTGRKCLLLALSLWKHKKG